MTEYLTTVPWDDIAFEILVRAENEDQAREKVLQYFKNKIDPDILTFSEISKDEEVVPVAVMNVVDGEYRSEVTIRRGRQKPA